MADLKCYSFKFSFSQFFFLFLFFAVCRTRHRIYICQRSLTTHLKKEAPKYYKILATLLCFFLGHSFRQPNRVLLFQKNQNGKIHTSPQSACCTQVTTSLKTYWNTISETENDEDQSADFQKSGTSPNNWRNIWGIHIWKCWIMWKSEFGVSSLWITPCKFLNRISAIVS